MLVPNVINPMGKMAQSVVRSTKYRASYQCKHESSHRSYECTPICFPRDSRLSFLEAMYRQGYAVNLCRLAYAAAQIKSN